MPVTILMAIGWVLVVMMILALVTGRVMAGGLRAKYYSRANEPRQYYAYLFAYGAIALAIFYSH